MAKNIVSVGLSLPSDDIDYIPLDSDQSLLDADIIIVHPGIPREDVIAEYHQGKPCLSDRDSFSARESLAHWRNEIRDAFAAGKLVVVYLRKPQVVLAATGQKQFSGTGKNARETRLVEPLNSYHAVPLALEYVGASGARMKPHDKLEFFVSYWSEFAEYSRYELYMRGDGIRPLLVTRDGGRIVAGFVSRGPGALLLLPPVDLALAGCIKKTKSGKQNWTEQSEVFGRRLVKSYVSMADSLRRQHVSTPPPAWSKQERFRLSAESRVAEEISQVREEIEALRKRKDELSEKHTQAGGPRRLLYESGKPLESAVLEALRILGFAAETFCGGDSEFDAVFVSPEGRFIGEVEGKDSKAVNIQKMSQLERNIQEDFQREEVDAHAKGVLFGNALRLKPPEERPDCFTEKCVTAAKRSGVALVRTWDLFNPVRYLSDTPDDDYAASCRRAIVQAEGVVVVFPEVPREADRDDVD